MPKRLPPQPREWIDRSRSLKLRFEGRDYTGYAGDSIASALLGAGVEMLGRSFKYHRPRGVASAAGHDANALFQSPDSTHLRGDGLPLEDGMVLDAVNTIGGLAADRGRYLEWLAPFLPVGFYYKTFHRPKALFPLWERMIRSAAGLGRIDAAWRVPRQAKQQRFCDLLVVGAGPSGLAAAVAAGEAGARVLLVDENPVPGGSFDYQHAGDADARAERNALLERIEALPNVERLDRALAAGYYADHWIPVLRPEGLVRIRARAVIVATGVIEQPAVFRGNDLPGVMLATAAQRLIHRYAVSPGERAVVLAGNAQAYAAALDLHRNGLPVAAVVDLEDPAGRGAMVESLRSAGIEVIARHTVYAAEGKGRLEGVGIAPLANGGENGRKSDEPDPAKVRSIACDTLLMSVGWAPAAPLLYQAGTRMRYAERPGQFLPDALPAGVFAAGRVNGVFGLPERLVDGRAAAADALAHLGMTVGPAERPGASHDRHSHEYPIFDHPKGRNFVDLDEDLQLKDLERAALEGFDNIELLKRYSTVGMGPSQGKLSNMNAVRILARHREQSIDATGTTTARPFVQPVPLKALAGARFRPERRSPMHAWHEAHGARFMPAGHWERPRYYGPGEAAEAVTREVLAVREGVGLIDVSTLGKIEVFGPQAAEFLDRCYTTRLSTVKLGMTRYALMVDDAGVIIDDGIAARLAEDHFYVTTTTTAADSVLRNLQRYAIEWRMDVELVGRTGQNAAMNLAGPLTREVLGPLTELDLSQEAFPFLGLRAGRVAGVEALLMRVGFVGELGYEIHVPAREAAKVWEAIMEQGAALGIQPFGVEAQRQLRLEKGHVIVGQDTDGTTTPYDCAMGWGVKLDKPFFVGQRSLRILKEHPRMGLVGFILPKTQAANVPEECHLVIRDGDIAGRVTSIGWSPGLDCYVGLALVDADTAGGSELEIRVAGGVMVTAGIVPLPFYDPDNTRQKPPVARPEAMTA